MRKYFLFASACVGLIVAAGSLSAQGNNATLTGSWTLTFSPTSPTPTVTPAGGFGGLATFISDGTVVETDTSQTAPSATSNATPLPEYRDTASGSRDRPSPASISNSLV